MEQNMEKTKMQLVGDIPFVGVFIVASLVCAYILEFTFGLTFALRVLGISSIFDRWLSSYTILNIFFMIIGAYGIQWFTLRVVRAIT